MEERLRRQGVIACDLTSLQDFERSQKSSAQ